MEKYSKFQNLPQNVPKNIVFYKIDDNGITVPHNSQPSQKWDADHVRMPCNPLSFCNAFNSDGTKILKSRWKVIQESLSAPINDIFDLKRVILSYNKMYDIYWNFEAITRLFTEELSNIQNRDFFQNTLPVVAKLVLNTPNYITKPIPLLKSGQEGSLSFSSIQVACLLSNAFFCTFPRRFMISYFTDNPKHMNNTLEYGRFPNINFDTLFSHVSNKSRYGGLKAKMAKLKCLINYLTHICVTMNGKDNAQLRACCQGNRIITYRRCVLSPTKNIVDWSESRQMIGEISLDIDSESDIFSTNQNYAKVDFANAFIGGGTLNYGCVQEEILFITNPELLVCRLFMEELNDLESICVQGHLCFIESNIQYRGYGATFEFLGDCTKIVHHSKFDMETNNQKIEYDRFGRLRNYMVAIDATNYYRKREIQYKKSQITREILKVYCGFYKFSKQLHKLQQDSATSTSSYGNEVFDFDALPTAVSTGKWGCGVYGGDVELKFLIQLLVCAQLGLHLRFCTFHSNDLEFELSQISQSLIQANISVGDCWQLLMKYSDLNIHDTDHRSINISLFQYLKREIDKK